jgi:molybdenum cofactor cytidylyltransferase
MTGDPRPRAVGIAGVVLAAGEGARFGGPKQLAQLDGRPLLSHVVATMSAVCERVVVVLGARAEEVRAAAGGAETVLCAAWQDGIYASLQCGLAALGDDPDAVVVALGDQPSLSRARIEAVLAFDAPIARARDGGAPSHPVVIRRGAPLTHDAMRQAPGPDLGLLPDVDTPAELEAFRGARST